MMTQTENRRLEELRSDICRYMSGKRLSHTYAVEREASVLAGIYAPDEEFSLRAAALLHDITKELDLEKQLQLCDRFGITYTDEEKLTPKILHSRTAPSVIEREFPEYSTRTVLNAVRWHTTGRAGMSLTEQILFLADYIEDTRTFDSCITLRRFFYEGLESAPDADSRAILLADTMILAFDMTVRELLECSAPIHAETVAARNSFIALKRGGSL